MGISRLFDHPEIIDTFHVEEHQQNAQRTYYRLSITFIDGSVLHVREYVSITERNYSFHWQNQEGLLILRWDNSPHHRHLPNFPHHYHENGDVKPCEEMHLDTVLDIIRNCVVRK